jgi:hypothetical protein
VTAVAFARFGKCPSKEDSVPNYNEMSSQAERDERIPERSSGLCSAQRAIQFIGKRSRAPIFLDVFYDQFRALRMAYVWRVLRAVHRIR